MDRAAEPPTKRSRARGKVEQDVKGDDQRRWPALLLVCAAQLMIVLDGTIVNVALPTIQDSLGFSETDEAAPGKAQA